MHGRAVRLAHRTDGLANLRGVAQHEVGGPVDHVVEIDRAGAGQRILVALEYRPEHDQECFRPLAVGEGCRALGDFCEGQPGTLEVLQERREQSRERVDPALLFEDSM